MGKIVNVEGINVEIAGDQITKEEFDYIKDIKSNYAKSIAGETEKDIDPATGYYKLPEVDAKIRFAVSAAPNLDSKFLTLKKFFKDVRQDEFDPSNFIVTDANDKKYILDDKSKTNFKDVIDEGKTITQLGASIGAGLLTAPTGPGAIISSGAALAGSSEVYERLGQLAGTEIERTPGEYLKTRLGEFTLGAVAQAAGPLLLRGTKYVLRGGSDKAVYDEAAKLLKLPQAEGKAAYDSLSLTDKIDKGIKLNMKDKLTLYNEFKTSPTIGQVTENKVFDVLETTFSNVPFAAPIMREAAEKAQNTLGDTFSKKLSENLGKFPVEKVTPDYASQIIQQGLIKKSKDFTGGKTPLGDLDFGIYGKSGFFERFKQAYAVKDAAVQKAVGNNLKVPLTNFQGFLAKEVGNDVDKLTKVLDDSKLLRIYTDINEKIAAGQTPTFSSVNRLKKQIGEKLGDPVLIDSIPRGTYKKLYGLLSEDIKTAVKTKADNKLALRLLEDANKYYSTNRQVIDDILNNIAKKADVDDLTNQLFTKSKKGATTISALMNSLEEPEKKVLVTAIINKLGQGPVTGEAAALGKTNFFNSSVFLKNYGAMEESAKKALFSGYKELGDSLKKLNKVSTYIEKQNPFTDLGQTATKGTAGTGLIVGAGAGLTAGTGNPLFLLGIPIFGYGGGYALKVMSNPKFLNWIADGVPIAAKEGFDGIASHLTKLGVIAGNSDDDTSQLSNQYLEMIKKSAGNSEKNQASQNISKAISGQKAAQAETKASDQKQMAPVNTRITNIDQSSQVAKNPALFRALNPGDSLGQAIAEKNALR
jgi:hypothetical protein